MVRKPVSRKSASPVPSKPGRKQSYAALLKAIESANTQMVGRAAAVVNQALVLRNWLIGACIVEYEQGGADRAKYGMRLLERLAKDLAARGVGGLGLTTRMMSRMCFAAYPQIRQTLFDEFAKRRPVPPIGPTLSDEFSADFSFQLFGRQCLPNVRRGVPNRRIGWH